MGTAGIVGMEESDTRADCEGSFGEREGELAEVLYSEGSGNFGIILWKTDFLVGFAAGYFEGRFVQGVGFTAWERCLSCLMSARLNG